jgi:hypothetical protein
MGLGQDKRVCRRPLGARQMALVACYVASWQLTRLGFAPTSRRQLFTTHHAVVGRLLKDVIPLSLPKKLWEEPPDSLLVLLVLFTKQCCQMRFFGICRRPHPYHNTHRK